MKEGDIVKIDIGVHVDGYIGDTALTISLGEQEDLLEASKKALYEAINLVRPGVKIKEIGEVIQKTIEDFGFKPIRNLTGHGLKRFDIHADPQIPNIKIDSNEELKEDDVIAIEPFASNGNGFVRDLEDVRIFSIIENENKIRSPEAREIYAFGMKRYGLPFASRWLNMPYIKFRIGLKELLLKNMIYPYYVLVEKEGALVSQFEHTIIVKDKPIIITSSPD